MYYVSLLRSSWRSMNEMDTQSAGKACNKDRGEEREREGYYFTFFPTQFEKKNRKIIVSEWSKINIFWNLFLSTLRAPLIFNYTFFRFLPIKVDYKNWDQIFFCGYIICNQIEIRALFSNNTKIWTLKVFIHYPVFGLRKP